MTYKILMHVDVDEMEKAVNHMLKAGFRLHGYLTNHNGNLCQAMIKHNVAEVIVKQKRTPRI